MAVVERAKLQFICWYFKVKKVQEEKQRLVEEALKAAQAKEKKYRRGKRPGNVSYMTSKENTNNLISYIFITVIISVLSFSVCLEIRRRRLLSVDEEVIDAEFIDHSSAARRNRVMQSIMATFAKIDYEEYRGSFRNETEILEVDDVNLEVKQADDSCNYEDDHEEADSPSKKASLDPNYKQMELESPEPKSVLDNSNSSLASVEKPSEHGIGRDMIEDCCICLESLTS